MKEFIIDVIIAILAGGVGASVIGLFFMSKKERVEHRAKLIEIYIQLVDKVNDTYDELNAAISDITCKLESEGDKRDEKLRNQCFLILTKYGNRYFDILTVLSDSMLTDNIDKGIFERTFLDRITNAVDETIGKYHSSKVLLKSEQEIGALKQSDYKSIYEIYNRYCGKNIEQKREKNRTDSAPK